MFHKAVNVHGHHVRLHSIDGRTWTSGSRRYAARLQLAYFARKRDEYKTDGAYVDKCTPESLEVFPCDPS